MGYTGAEQTIAVSEWAEGNGAYKPNSIAIAAKAEMNAESLSIRLVAYPNPVVSTATVSYNTVETGLVGLELFNVLGAKVKNLLLEQQSAGSHELIIDLSNQEPGVYYIKLHVDNQELTHKITKI